MSSFLVCFFGVVFFLVLLFCHRNIVQKLFFAELYLLMMQLILDYQGCEKGIGEEFLCFKKKETWNNCN